MKKVRAEFHVHTRFSKDSILNKYFLLLMCKIKKINLLAITDHNEIRGALKYKSFFLKHKIEIIVGEEIMTTNGEIIGLYLEKKISPNLSVKKTIDEIRKQGGLVYLPHPYDEKRYKTVLDKECQKKYKNEIDFIEVHNGRNIKEDFDKRQEEIQKKLNITPIIGSDAHTFFEVGRNYVELEYNGKENLVESINKASFHKRKCILFAHKVTKLARIIKMIESGDISGIFRIVIRKCKGDNQ